jgi:NCS1 family nucleobase:cation symporter-1
VIQQKEKSNLMNWELVSVNPNNKIWNWKDLFCFWGSNIQSIIGFSLIASLYIVYQLNFFVVLIGCIIGSLLVYIFSNLIGKPSQKHGIPFPVFLRLSMGVYGARYVAILRGLVGVFMFGVQTYFISKSVGYLIRISLFSIDGAILDKDIFLFFFMGMNTIDWFSLIFTLWIQYLLFSNGQRLIKAIINFSTLFVYLGLIIFFMILISENYNEIKKSFNDLFQNNDIYNKENLIALLSIAGTFFAYFSIVIVNFGDFSRYAKNESEVNKGNLSLFLNLIIFSFLAVFLVLGSSVVFEKNLIPIDRILTNPTDIIGKFDNTYLTFIALLFIFVASGSTNLIANYIPSQNSIINFFPNKSNLKSSGLIIIFLGLIFAVFWDPILSKIGILSLVDTIGSFFGPIAGVMLTDYYFIKNKKVINKDIFSINEEGAYYYSGGWQIKALYSLFIGFIFASATIWNAELRFLQPFSWIIGSVFSSITYYLLASK